MLTILIVDDEKSAREQIAYTLRHGLADEAEIKTVPNGYRALELMREQCPDILLTDIRMPKMDGITLAEKARELDPEIKIIFTTAYADKDILKSAIQISVVSFVEKPFMTEELLAAVKKAAALIEQSRRYISLNTPHLVLTLGKKETEKDQILALIGSDGYAKLENKHFKSVVIRCVPDVPQSAVNQSQILAAIASLLKGKPFQCMYAFRSDDVCMAHFYFPPSVDGETEIPKFLLAFMDAVPLCRFFCCVGETAECLETLYRSCEEAAIGLERSFFRDSFGIVEPIRGRTGDSVSKVDISDLYALLEAGDKEGVEALLQSLFDSLLNSDNTLVSTARNYYIDIVNRMFTFSANYRLKFHEIHNRNNALSKVIALPWLKLLDAYVRDLLEQLFVSADLTGKDHILVQKILGCIEENYADSGFSVRYIAEYCRFTPSYVSMIFKGRMGCTINSYINDLRLQKARAKLISTNETLEEIALSAGYNSSNYFCNIFKKSMGVTPTEYRNKFKK